jgi:hypothetical protein
MMQKQKINRLIKYVQGPEDYVVRYRGHRITRIDKEQGIFVWELFGPDMSDLVLWKNVQWEEFTIYIPVNDPFKP